MSDPLLNVMKIMLLAGLYLFFIRVLWAVYTEIRDPRTRAGSRGDDRQTAASQGPAPTLRTSRKSRRRTRRGGSAVVVGQLTIVDPAPMAGTAYALANDVTIGRAPTNGIRIDDGYVSQVHARIFATDEGFFVEDLGSSNGSQLNGEALSATSVLVPGDRLTIGATVLEFS